MRNMEGFSRRRTPSDRRRDVEDQAADMESRTIEERKASIVDDIHEVDASQKKLTGRRPEEYASESGVPESELFPEDAEILNVGDPWQKLDLPGVTSIDYEYGEEAEFVRDVPEFLAEAPKRIDRVAKGFVLLEKETGALSIGPFVVRLRQKIQNIQQIMRHGSSEDYHGIGDQLLAAAKLISETEDREWQKQDTAAEEASVRFYAHELKQLWYDIERLGRGFHDAHLTKTVIEPAIIRETVRRKGLTEAQTDALRRELIEEHRFKKKTKHATVKKGTFPDAHFADHSFDRIIASWSVSTHLFPLLLENEFRIYWEEIDRLLKKDGVAIIWPIYHGNETDLAESLRAYARTGGDACVFPINPDTGTLDPPVFASDRAFVSALEDGETLMVFPKRASQGEKERLLGVIDLRQQAIKHNPTAYASP